MYQCRRVRLPGGAAVDDITSFCHAEGLAVDEQLDLVAMARGDIHRLLRVRRIIPVADDVDVRLLVLHHARDVEQRLRQAHAVHLAAHAQDVAALLAAVGVGVRPIDRGVGRPLRVRGIGVVDAVAHIARVARRGGEAEGLGVPVPGVDGPVADLAGLGLETEMRRRVIVPDVARRPRRGNPPSRSAAPCRGARCCSRGKYRRRRSCRSAAPGRSSRRKIPTSA